MNANASDEKRGTLAVLALIFGIAAIVISWAPFVLFLGFLAAIVLIILNFQAFSSDTCTLSMLLKVEQDIE